MNSSHQRGIARTQFIVLVSTVFLVIVLVVVTRLLLHDPRSAVRKAGDTFMSALAKDDAITTYNMFTSRLKKQTSSSAWKQQVDGSFKDYKGTPTYLSTAAVVDPYHVYKSGSNPTRLTYRFGFSGKRYDMSIILLKSNPKDTAWQVDEWDTKLQ